MPSSEVPMQTSWMNWAVWLRRLLLLLTSVYLLVLIGDFGYSCWVNLKIKSWESSQSYDAQGVREGCEAYQRGEGTDAVLLIHGFNDSPRLWDFFTERLVKQGFTCRAMRLPGFAMRNAEYATGDLDQWVLAVGEEVQRLSENHRHVHVVAHSLGAAVALRFDLLSPGQADTLNLIAPCIEISSARSPVLTARQWQLVGRILLVFTQSTYNPFNPDIKDPTSPEYPWRVPATPRSVIRETFHAMDAIRGKAKDLTTPLFMVASNQDLVVDRDRARQFFDEAGATDKQWLSADRSGHLIPYDLDRDRVLDEMLKFWEAVEPKLNSQPQESPAEKEEQPSRSRD